MNQKHQASTLPADTINSSPDSLTPLPLARTAPCPLCRRKSKLVAVEAAAKGTTEYTFECGYSGCTTDNKFVVIQNDYDNRRI
jgi:hypothetical protein